MEKILFIDGKRSGYAPEQCGETLTVGQLAQILNRAIEWGELSADMPIYLCNDNGYTYGDVSAWNSFRIGEDWDSQDAYDWCPEVLCDDDDEDDPYDRWEVESSRDDWDDES